MDTRTTATRKLFDQIAATCGIEAAAVSNETLLEEIGLDSIALAMILRAVEVEFAIEFNDDEVAAFLGAASVGEYLPPLRSALSRGVCERPQPA